jgi:serine-type D-Ala-D-Ala carboxypeptidase (penicillin-binding protein 5/6)
VASTQKLLAALVAVEAGDLDREVTIREEDMKTQAVVMPLRPGNRHPRRELVRMMLVASANDAACALARDIAGSSRSFAELMNRRAASLGMEDSRFLNPHGLTVKGQHSTARDLAIVARAAYGQPVLREACGMKSLRYRGLTFPNGNRLLGSMPGCDGLKSGYTRAAGRCLVATAGSGNQALIVVLLGGTDGEIWTDAEKLFRWAAPLTPR